MIQDSLQYRVFICVNRWFIWSLGDETIKNRSSSWGEKKNANIYQNLAETLQLGCLIGPKKEWKTVPCTSKGELEDNCSLFTRKLMKVGGGSCPVSRAGTDRLSVGGLAFQVKRALRQTVRVAFRDFNLTGFCSFLFCFCFFFCLAWNKKEPEAKCTFFSFLFFLS